MRLLARAFFNREVHRIDLVWKEVVQRVFYI